MDLMAWKEPRYNRNITSTLEIEDLNRIEGNIKFLAKIARSHVEVKLDWSRYDFPKQSDFERICKNIEVLFLWYGVPENAPPVPVAPFLYYSKIDDIEYIIYLIYEKYIDSIATVIFTSEAYAGNEIGVI